MTDNSPFYITTAISYPNGKPHIGHAYELIATDALARFQRLDGRPVYFLTGTDEHGQKMQQTARAEGITAQELASGPSWNKATKRSSPLPPENAHQINKPFTLCVREDVRRSPQRVISNHSNSSQGNGGVPGTIRAEDL